MLAVIRIFQIAALLAARLQGCATAAEVGLLSPTDSSGLKPGMTVVEVHEPEYRDAVRELLSSGG